MYGGGCMKCEFCEKEEGMFYLKMGKIGDVVGDYDVVLCSNCYSEILDSVEKIQMDAEM